MTKEELMKALGDVDLKYIEEAAPGNQVTSSISDDSENEETAKVVDISTKAAEIREKRKKRSNLPKIIVFAAAACLVGAIAIRTINSGIFFMGGASSAQTEQAAALEEAAPEAEEAAEAETDETLTVGAAETAADTEENADGLGEEAANGKEDDVAQIPNPFVDCKNLEEAEALAGITMTVPASLAEATDAAGLTSGTEAADAAAASAADFRAVAGEMIEVIYRNAGGEEVFRIRKSTGEGDISGDYTDYSEITNITVNEMDVTIKGVGDGTGYSVATWDDGTYSYSITAEQPLGVEYMRALVSAVG